MTGFPSVDVRSIGAGGGSIATVDEAGLLRVGPQSAGSLPGPACYAQGGLRPTVTDAALLLGYLDPAFFLGGRRRLDVGAARAALMTDVARPLGLDLEDAAGDSAPSRERARSARRSTSPSRPATLTRSGRSRFPCGSAAS